MLNIISQPQNFKVDGCSYEGSVPDSLEVRVRRWGPDTSVYAFARQICTSNTDCDNYTPAVSINIPTGSPQTDGQLPPGTTAGVSDEWSNFLEVMGGAAGCDPFEEVSDGPDNGWDHHLVLPAKLDFIMETGPEEPSYDGAFTAPVSTQYEAVSGGAGLDTVVVDISQATTSSLGLSLILNNYGVYIKSSNYLDYVDSDAPYDGMDEYHDLVGMYLVDVFQGDDYFTVPCLLGPRGIYPNCELDYANGQMTFSWEVSSYYSGPLFQPETRIPDSSAPPYLSVFINSAGSLGLGKMTVTVQQFEAGNDSVGQVEFAPDVCPESLYSGTPDGEVTWVMDFTNTAEQQAEYEYGGNTYSATQSGVSNKWTIELPPEIVSQIESGPGRTNVIVKMESNSGVQYPEVFLPVSSANRTLPA